MFVYFVQCGEAGGPIKIGVTQDVDQRLSRLQVGCPIELTLLASIYVDDGEKLEADLHRRFATSRIRGEWFEGTYAVRSAAMQVAKLASRQSDQAATAGPIAFEWRGVVRDSVEMPDPSVLVTSAVGSRTADPRKLRAPPASGYFWRGKWRT